MWGLLASVAGNLISANAAKKQMAARQSAAERERQLRLEAATPWDVIGPSGQVTYDPETKQVVSELSPELTQLREGLFSDIPMFREMVSPYLSREGFEGEAQRRAAGEQALIEKATQDALEEKFGRLVGRGLAGSTLGAEALSQTAQRGAESGIAALQRQRGLLSGEITDALNRESMARTGYANMGNLISGYGAMGTLPASNQMNALGLTGTPILQNAYMSASAQAQPSYQLGSALGNLTFNQGSTNGSAYDMIDGIGVTSPSSSGGGLFGGLGNFVSSLFGG